MTHEKQRETVIGVASTPCNGRFAGKVALVTGATNGIGRATAVRLAAEGALVVVNQRPTGDPSATLQEIHDVGGSAFSIVADMRDPQQVLAMVDGVVERAGRLDYVVSNAAVNPHKKWDETTLEDWDLICDTNLRGTWLVCTEAARRMIAAGHGGAIVCVSSISATVAGPDQTAYCATKAGISMLSKALASVLGDHDIRVNCVEPGAIRTNMSSRMDSKPDTMRYYLDRIALHRIGQPSEMAGVISFLLSDDASYVTGATVVADGAFVVNAEI